MGVIADEKQVAALVEKLAGDIGSAMTASGGRWAFVGIRARGDVLAARLAARLKPEYVGTVDIAMYRDDLSEIGSQPTVRTTEIDFDIDGLNVLLVDDVLMTGRSIRAALQSLIDFGRPKCVRLAVLVDRGGRELPIAADFVGLSLHADGRQLVKVHFKEHDDTDWIETINAQKEIAN